MLVFITLVYLIMYSLIKFVFKSGFVLTYTFLLVLVLLQIFYGPYFLPKIFGQQKTTPPPPTLGTVVGNYHLTRQVDFNKTIKSPFDNSTLIARYQLYWKGEDTETCINDDDVYSKAPDEL